MPKPLPGHLGRDLTDVHRAQIRALSRAGFEVTQLSVFYLRNPRAIKRARDNNLANKADLSKDSELLDDTFMAYLNSGDVINLEGYITASVTNQTFVPIPAAGGSATGRGKRKKSPSTSIDLEDENAMGGHASDDYTPPATKKPRAAVQGRSRKEPVRSITKPRDLIVISDDEQEPMVKEEIAEEEDVKPSLVWPSRTPTTSPSRNSSAAPLAATSVDPSTRLSSCGTPTWSRDTPSNRYQSSSSVTTITVGSSLRTFLNKVIPPLIHYDVAIHQYGICTSEHLRALRDMPKKHRDSTLQRLQEATGMTPFQAQTFDVALDKFV